MKTIGFFMKTDAFYQSLGPKTDKPYSYLRFLFFLLDNKDCKLSEK